MKTTNLFLLILLATCGLTASPSARADDAAMQDWAKQKYLKLSSPEMSVRRSDRGGILLGVSVMQKDDTNGDFCRKSKAVAPNAKPSYECFSQALTGKDAEEAYSRSGAKVFDVMFFRGDSPLLGSHWSETRASQDGEDFLCVQTSAVVPHPVYSYSCYSNRPKLGGGISVGN